MRQLGFDLETCPRCGDKMKVIALVQDPQSIARYLRHLGLPIEEPSMATENWCREARFSSDSTPQHRSEAGSMTLRVPEPLRRPKHAQRPFVSTSMEGDVKKHDHLSPGDAPAGSFLTYDSRPSLLYTVLPAVVATYRIRAR
jgi:hypothetical protein